ncbi:MAG: DUF3857 domain-containing protein [Flavisolibacter sp.]
MKIIYPVFSLLLFLMIPVFTKAQSDDHPGFTAEEFAMKECSFDKSAEAVILSDRAVSNYNDNYNLVTTRKVRFKILKEKGIDRGNITIRFYSKDGFELITRVHATIATPGENGPVWNKLEQRSIYTKKINELYSDITFAMPNVKVGSIIEYEYESTMEHYGGLQDWYFQSDIPVVSSSYQLYVVPNAEFRYFVRKNHSWPCNVKTDESAGWVSFEMNNLPGLRDESYSTSYRDYMQRVDFQLSAVRTNTGSVIKYTTTWKDMTKELLEDNDFGKQLSKKNDATSEIALPLLTAKSGFEKMMIIHDYVCRNYVWNNIESKYAYVGLKNLVETKKGSSGDLNLLMVNLARSAGLTAYPMLVSERSHGKVDTTYPVRDQFNKVVAYVEADGNKYTLDATDPYTPAGATPLELLNTIGYVIDKKAGEFVMISDGGKKRMAIINIKSSIDKSAQMKGEASIDYYDYARFGKPEKYKRSKDGYIQDFLKAVPAVSVDSFMVNNLDADSLALNHHFFLNEALSKSGNYYLLNFNLFTGFEKNPFISNYRFTNIDFGARYACIVSESFTLSENMLVESLPKDSKMITPDNSLVFLREIRQNGNEIRVNLRIEFNASEFSSENYDGIKDFFKKMTDMLNEPVVLKNK